MLLSSILPLKPFLKFVKMYQIKNSKYVHSFLGGSVNFKKGVFERRWIFEAIDMPFESITIPVSLHYHELLTMQYGEYMTLPPIEDRKCKVHAILVDTDNDFIKYKTYRDGMIFDTYTRSIR
jgi:lipopolysaccharide cholinephosphotransferase